MKSESNFTKDCRKGGNRRDAEKPPFMQTWPAPE